LSQYGDAFQHDDAYGNTDGDNELHCDYDDDNYLDDDYDDNNVHLRTSARRSGSISCVTAITALGISTFSHSLGTRFASASLSSCILDFEISEYTAVRKIVRDIKSVIKNKHTKIDIFGCKCHIVPHNVNIFG
jgi:hypothetical protein